MNNHFYMYINFTEAEDKQDYGYWLQLVAYYLKLADSIDLHVWNEEVEVIRELEEKTTLHKRDLTPLMMTGFTGAITPELIHFILNESFNSSGAIKWFSMFFKREGKLLFESGHNGSELIAQNPDAKEIAMMKSVLPVNATFQHFT